MIKIREKIKVKRCIGIDIGHSYLRVIQIAETAEHFIIEKVFCTQTRRTTDSLPEILMSLANQHGFDRRAKVAVSMPINTIFFRYLEINTSGLNNTREQNLSPLEHNFPIENEEIITQTYSQHHLQEEKHFVITTATDKRLLSERLQQLAKAKIQPSLIDASVSAIHSIVAINQPEISIGQAIIAYLDESYLTLAITQDNNIIIVRNISLPSSTDNNIESMAEQVAQTLVSETKITWRKIFRTEIQQNLKIYLITHNHSYNAAIMELVEEELHCRTITIEPFSKLEIQPDCKLDNTQCIALGLALRGLSPDKFKGINFLNVINNISKPKLNMKKELATCTTLIIAIAAFWLIGLFIQLSYLESNYKKMKSEINEVFQQSIPEEKNIVSPLGQLQQKLDYLRKDYNLFGSFSPEHLTPLDILHSISSVTPSNINVKIEDILIAADSVRITGTSDSFETAYQWQRLLGQINAFKQVDIKDIQKQPQDGLISFTMILSGKTRQL